MDKPVPVSPWFLSLTVQNVRCFGHRQTLDLSNGHGRPAHWTIILGENGSGKSCLLQSLASMAPLEWIGFNLTYSADGEWPRRLDASARRRSGGPTAIEATVGLSSTLVSTPFETVNASYGWRENGESIDNTYVFSRSERLWPDDGSDGPRPTALEPAGMLCLGYGAYRRWGRTRLASIEQLPDATLFDPEAVLPSPEEWFLQRDYAAENPRNEANVRQQARTMRTLVGDALLALLPGVDALETRVLDAKSGRTELLAKVADGTIPVAELGLGYQSTLAWVVDLAARLVATYPHSSNPLSEPAVVLIDEIDIHLHPRWQRTLLRELGERFPNVQFIATAHSPLVVQGAPDANIVVLHRHGSDVAIDNNPISVRHWRVDQILTSDLFGLEGTRDPEIDGLIARRDKLLAKRPRTKGDEAEIAQLDAKLGSLPEGETPQQREAMQIIMKAAAELKATGQDVGAPKRKHR